MRTLGFAILGLLAAKPRTGYDIAKTMRTPVGYLWSASHSQIYPELQTLRAAGLVKHRVVDGPGPRDNLVYSITARGHRELSAWVDSPLTPRPARSELMLRVRTLWVISPERAIQFVATTQLESEHRLATYQEIENEFREGDGEPHDPTTPEFGSWATLQAGIAYERYLIGWMTWLLEQLHQQVDVGS